MFKAQDKSEQNPFRTRDNDKSIEFFAISYNIGARYELTYRQENENYNQLDRLAKFMKNKISGNDPIMTRSYKNDSEKDNFSICVHGYRLNGMEDRHPIMKYLSAYKGLEITQEYQDYGANVWIFTFPKTECETILKGMKQLDFDDDLLESLDKEAQSHGGFC